MDGTMNPAWTLPTALDRIDLILESENSWGKLSDYDRGALALITNEMKNELARRNRPRRSTKRAGK